jgi:hypothetical protein
MHPTLFFQFPARRSTPRFRLPGKRAVRAGADEARPFPPRARFALACERRLRQNP